MAARSAGLLEELVGPAAMLLVVACGVVGIRRHRPTVQWPWWATVAAGVLWTAAGIASDITTPVGDFTSTRSLLPDVFALPAYCLFGAAVFGLLRARRPESEHGALLDGIMLAAGALLMVNELLIAPVHSPPRRPGSWPGCPCRCIRPSRSASSCSLLVSS